MRTRKIGGKRKKEERKEIERSEVKEVREKEKHREGGGREASLSPTARPITAPSGSRSAGNQDKRSKVMPNN